MQIVLIVVFMNVIIWVFYMPFTPIQQKMIISNIYMHRTFLLSPYLKIWIHDLICQASLSICS